MRAPLLLAWLLAALAALAPGGGLRADSLLTNGSFESGASGWEVPSGSLDFVTEPSLVAEGSRAAALTVTSILAEVNQPVTLVPGGSYRLSGQFLFADPTATRVKLNLVWFEADGGYQIQTAGLLSTPSASYRSLSRVLSISCDVVESEVEVLVNGAAGSTVYLDDLRLETAQPLHPCPTPPVSPTLPPTAPPDPAPSPEAPSTPAAPTDADPQAPAPVEPEASPTPSHGLLINGGIEAAENGTPVAWRTQGGTLTQANAPVHSGRFAGAFLSSTTATKWVYQTVAVEPAAWYELDGYVYLDDPNVEAAFLRISWYLSSDGSGPAAATVDSTSQLDEPEPRYRRLTTGPVQAPPGVHSAKARILLRPRSTASALIYIDDISFRPAAPGPLTAGAGGTGARTTSEVLGASQSDGTWPYTPQPTPVIRRISHARIEAEPPSGGGLPWWPWALAGGVLAACGALGWGAYRWRQNRKPGESA